MSAMLLAKGVSGSRIGEIVAELDEHVAMAGTDPVEELGPVGELSEALAEAVADRIPLLSLVASTLMGITVALSIVSAVALFTRSSSGEAVIDLGMVAYLAVFTAGIGLLRMYGSKRIVGKSRIEMPALKVFLPFLIIVGVTSAATQSWDLAIPTGAAVAVLVVSGSIAVALVVWSMRRSRIVVPGRVGHLRRLEWGVFGK
jgi:hypothetical protein